MINNKKNSLKKIVAAITLSSFSLVTPTVALANENIFHSNYPIIENNQQNLIKNESFLYEENGKNYECVVNILEHTIIGTIYELQEDTKILYKEFSVTTQSNSIYLNGKLVSSPLEDNPIQMFQLYPYIDTHGTIDFSGNVTAAEIAASIFAAISITNPYIGVAVSVFIPVAGEVLRSNLKTGYYNVRSQMETFPTDVPPGYVNVIYKTDYQYRVYRTTNFISSNQLGSTIYDTYYAQG